ncbi:alpha/beta hydrolase [Solibacillus sp. R5-41]|uniref:alpha/beta fold hydrolase n=1 Tax=Solibacillus sp. R5-41 TaxID=2048654 RepID=UPI000C12494A|nr:alpha/beta hydrolase [Solibacillus sp. R5-41]ATP41312.1 alpha/beta hydrolase [Solibacillus sp. R5-41]
MVFKEFGDGEEILLFLHGGGVSSWMWESQINYFNNYHCIVPDLPGHGANSDELFSMSTTINKLWTILEEVAPNKNWNIIGFSLGSQIALQMINERPNSFKRAMINSALVIPQKTMSLCIPLTIFVTYPLIQKKTFAKLQAKTLGISDTYFEKYFIDTCNISRENLIMILKANLNFILPASITNANTQFLFTIGEKENWLMQRSIKTLARFGRTEIVEGVGHNAPLENQKVFNRLLDDLLKK